MVLCIIFCIEFDEEENSKPENKAFSDKNQNISDTIIIDKISELTTKTENISEKLETENKREIVKELHNNEICEIQIPTEELKDVSEKDDVVEIVEGDYNVEVDGGEIADEDGEEIKKLTENKDTKKEVPNLGEFTDEIFKHITSVKDIKTKIEIDLTQNDLNMNKKKSLTEMDKIKFESISSMKYESELANLAHMLVVAAIASAEYEENEREVHKVDKKPVKYFIGKPLKQIDSNLRHKAEPFVPRRSSVDSTSSLSAHSAEFIPQRCRSASSSSNGSPRPAGLNLPTVVDFKGFTPQPWYQLVADHAERFERSVSVDPQMFPVSPVGMNSVKPFKVDPVVSRMMMNGKAKEFIPRQPQLNESKKHSNDRHTETDVQKTDAAVNTPRKKQADFSVQHIGFSLCDVSIIIN